MNRNNFVKTRRRRSGAALLLAIFVMCVGAGLAVAICDTQSVRYAVLSNTRNWENARYLAEAGLQHALAMLETDYAYRDPIPETEFPVGSGQFYSASITEGTGGILIVEATGVSGPFARTLNAVVKHGG